MADQVLSLALNIHGTYKPADATIAPEIWVNTLRLRVTLGSLGDPIGTLTPQFSVVAAAITDSDPSWFAESNWRLEGGINDFDPVSYLVDQVIPGLYSWTALSGRSQEAIVTGASLYPIDTTGHAIAPPGTGAPVPATVTFTPTGCPQGASTGSMGPLQVACVTSHRTGFSGRKGRGRMFLAGLVQTNINAVGQFTSTFMSAALSKQVGLLTTLTIDDEAVSVHPALIPNFTSYAHITEVRVGSVPDTQRRRRNKLDETFVSDVVP